MVNSFPTNESLWERYAEIRVEGLRAGDGGAAGTEFYRQNRLEMDAGADVAWRQRFNHDELSAIQHAMNLKLQDEAAFFAEYQNDPLGVGNASCCHRRYRAIECAGRTRWVARVFTITAD